MKLVCGLVLLITIQYSSCQEGNADQLICRVHHYCASQQGENTRPDPVRVGKAGPIGPPGPKGETGEVDYSVVNRNINSVLEELRALENKVAWLQQLTHWYKASNGYYYKLFSTRKTWQQAKAACASEGTILVSAGIRDPTVRVELQNYAKLQTIWIGVSDIRQEGTWIWEDGVGSTGNDVGWYPREPNNSGNEDCAVLFNSSSNWKANDVSCSSAYAYLCEKSPQ